MCVGYCKLVESATMGSTEGDRLDEEGKMSAA